MDHDAPAAYCGAFAVAALQTGVDLVVVVDHIGVLVGVEVPDLGSPPPQATRASKVKPAGAMKPGMVAVARNTGFLLQERGGA